MVLLVLAVVHIAADLLLLDGVGRDASGRGLEPGGVQAAGIERRVVGEACRILCLRVIVLPIGSDGTSLEAEGLPVFLPAVLHEYTWLRLEHAILL